MFDDKKITIDSIDLTEEELDELMDACEVGFYYNEAVEREEHKKLHCINNEKTF